MLYSHVSPGMRTMSVSDVDTSTYSVYSTSCAALMAVVVP